MPGTCRVIHKVISTISMGSASYVKYTTVHYTIIINYYVHIKYMYTYIIMCYDEIWTMVQ